MTAGRRRLAGFTLLEVMVALAVLAAALMAVGDLSGNALRNFAYARDLSVATLLARGKMAELEERYEDSGFRDFDEIAEGDFTEEGRAEFHWKAEVKKPDTKLSAEQLLAVFLGADPDDANTQSLLSELVGGKAGAAGAPSSGPAAAAAGPGGPLGGLLGAQLTAFGEEIKKSMRELRLTVSWKDGKRDQGFDVSTYLVVLNPKAAGGSRGADPDIPPGISAASPLSGLLPGAGAIPGQGGNAATSASGTKVGP